MMETWLLAAIVYSKIVKGQDTWELLESLILPFLFSLDSFLFVTSNLIRKMEAI
jgi:hypothetical protein